MPPPSPYPSFSFFLSLSHTLAFVTDVRWNDETWEEGKWQAGPVGRIRLKAEGRVEAYNDGPGKKKRIKDTFTQSVLSDVHGLTGQSRGRKLPES